VTKSILLELYWCYIGYQVVALIRLAKSLNILFSLQFLFLSRSVYEQKSPIATIDRLTTATPLYLPAPRFQIGQWVYWKALKDPDFGHIVGLVWADEGSTKAIGYHYAVLLDKAAFSSAFIDLDWAFEDDLAVMPVHNPLVIAK
jgi:hypothetical protein